MLLAGFLLGPLAWPGDLPISYVVLPISYVVIACRPLATARPVTSGLVAPPIPIASARRLMGSPCEPRSR